MTLTLPEPTQEASLHSDRLTDMIREEILANNGKISFARFMELALYSPGLGYYSAGSQKFGEHGDFVTAPEISPLFSQCLANQCKQVLSQVDRGDILELGAGSGIMAVRILLELEQQECLPNNYYILEISADLKARQRDTLQQHCPQLLDKIRWLDQLPDEPISGVILANEVLDAMPVHYFRLKAGKAYERYVTWNDGQFAWDIDKPSNEAVAAAIDYLQEDVLLGVENFDSEINLNIEPWISGLSKSLQQGLILLIDYGFPRNEFYHHDRSMGTLMCHYRHRSHPDPLILPGLQDITAHVDFTAVAEAADNNDLEITGFTHQGGFLMGCGLPGIATRYVSQDERKRLELKQQINKLTMPEEMGELFKVIGLTRDIEEPLMGFEFIDLTHKL